MPSSTAPLSQDPAEERPVRAAMLRGWRKRCPNCGAGPLLRGYLAVRDSCPVCSEQFQHHRADDGPAYLTILIVGHLMAPLILWAFVEFRPDPLCWPASSRSAPWRCRFICCPGSRGR